MYLTVASIVLLVFVCALTFAEWLCRRLRRSRNRDNNR